MEDGPIAHPQRGLLWGGWEWPASCPSYPGASHSLSMWAVGWAEAQQTGWSARRSGGAGSGAVASSLAWPTLGRGQQRQAACSQNPEAYQSHRSKRVQGAGQASSWAQPCLDCLQRSLGTCAWPTSDLRLGSTGSLVQSTLSLLCSKLIPLASARPASGHGDGAAGPCRNAASRSLPVTTGATQICWLCQRCTRDWTLLLQWLLVVMEHWVVWEQVWELAWKEKDVTWKTTQEESRVWAQKKHWTWLEAMEQCFVQLLQQ